MLPRNPLVVTGLGASIPGVEGLGGLLDLVESHRSMWAADGAVARPGTRFHDRATLLALAAGGHALQHAGLDESVNDDTGLGVAVSSNLGNLDTVCQTTEAIHGGSAADLRPMDLPKASSNVIPSVLAIRFRCRAMNALVCNGASSGLDVLHVAGVCLRAGRATRVLVVGVEPRHEPGQRLLSETFTAGGGIRTNLRVGEGAAAVVVEHLSDARARGAAVYARLDAYSCCRGRQSLQRSVAATLAAGGGSSNVDVWLVPNRHDPCVSRTMTAALNSGTPLVEPGAVCDLVRSFGELYGALGVLQCVIACLWLARAAADRRGGRRALLTAGGWNDGASSLLVSSPQ